MKRKQLILNNMQRINRRTENQQSISTGGNKVLAQDKLLHLFQIQESILAQNNCLSCFLYLIYTLKIEYFDNEDKRRKPIHLFNGSRSEREEIFINSTSLYSQKSSGQATCLHNHIIVLLPQQEEVSLNQINNVHHNTFTSAIFDKLKSINILRACYHIQDFANL
ncbi:unnamed protein product [Paramecium octaurelia]|uniref:Uncharacterized protein n=1 Tax=Paramecium octaurelia TaxID=43137 RepID=A0A8S1W4S4_PAROT|nr:unnamed protein product [Paramecium octaurelia]